MEIDKKESDYLFSLNHRNEVFVKWAWLELEGVFSFFSFECEIGV